MLDRTGDWCFEGGCTYLTSDDDTVRSNKRESVEQDVFYCVPCVGSYD